MATATNSAAVQITHDFRRMPAQRRFVGTAAHEAAFVGGIGSGKSYAGCVRALLAAYGYIGKTQRMPVPNLGMITAPTYPMLSKATIRTFLDVAGAAVAGFNRSEKLVTLKNGSEIFFSNASDPDQLRGPSLAWWFGDEAALYTPDVWGIMLGRLRQFGQRGYAWIATTPRGRNWVWQLFVQDQGRAIFRSSSADNVFLDRAIIEAWQQTYTGDFAAQELAGEFVAFEGLIYPEFRREVHVISQLPASFVFTLAGVDWGFANPGVIVVVGVDGDGRAWVIAEHYQRQQRVEEWVKVAQQVRDTWRPKMFYCDPSEPDYIAQFRAGNIPAQQANNAVNSGLQAVKNRLVKQADGKPRLMISREAVHLISEFESYVWAENRYGVRDEPVKANDHALDALRYAIMGIDAGAKPLTATTSRWA